MGDEVAGVLGILFYIFMYFFLRLLVDSVEGFKATKMTVECDGVRWME